jgi:hypothetical protein
MVTRSRIVPIDESAEIIDRTPWSPSLVEHRKTKTREIMLQIEPRSGLKNLSEWLTLRIINTGLFSLNVFDLRIDSAHSHSAFLAIVSSLGSINVD